MTVVFTYLVSVERARVGDNAGRTEVVAAIRADLELDRVDADRARFTGCCAKALPSEQLKLSVCLIPLHQLRSDQHVDFAVLLQSRNERQ